MIVRLNSMNDKLKLILALALNLILKCAQTLRKGLAFEHSLLKLSRLILDCSIEKLKSCKVEVNVPSVLTYLWTKAANFCLVAPTFNDDQSVLSWKIGLWGFRIRQHQKTKRSIKIKPFQKGKTKCSRKIKQYVPQR